MKKRMNGFQWYKTVHKFLSSHKSYLVITQSDTQKLLLIDIINSSKGEGIRLKAEQKKYGLYVSRGRRGDAAVVSEDVAKKFCEANGLTFSNNMDFIKPYSAKQFDLSHRLKNINVHRKKKIPKYLPYYEQLETKEWKEFREVVFASRGSVCEMCGAKTNLQVHHPKYVTGRKAWEYSTDEVVVLCKDCHKKIHNIK